MEIRYCAARKVKDEKQKKGKEKERQEEGKIKMARKTEKIKKENPVVCNTVKMKTNDQMTTDENELPKKGEKKEIQVKGEEKKRQEKVCISREKNTREGRRERKRGTVVNKVEFRGEVLPNFYSNKKAS